MTTKPRRSNRLVLAIVVALRDVERQREADRQGRIIRLEERRKAA